MSLVPMQYKCDGCGAERKETNHWYTAYKTSKTFGTVLSTWEEAKAGAILDFPGVRHLCGRNCVVKYISELMGE